MPVTSKSKVALIGQKAKATRKVAPEFKTFHVRLLKAYETYAQKNFPLNPRGAMTDLANKAGISVSTLSRAINEPDRDVSFNVALLLADALRHTVKPYWLLMGQGPSDLE